MTLLDATTTLIDAAKTHGPENDRVLARAVRRMEKRAELLRLRAMKARKRNRTKAFWDAMQTLNGRIAVAVTGSLKGKRVAVIPCAACNHNVEFGAFCQGAEFTGHGRFIRITCPNCQHIIERPKCLP